MDEKLARSPRATRLLTPRRLLRACGALALAGALAAPLVPSRAEAFCGFYVGGADKKLFNNATLVVLMRDGTRTVLSMQNNYQGPPENFAMVVPVPVVLQKENVKTLPREIFDKIDQLAAPRLVEYWEQDPCYVPPPMAPMAPGMAPAGAAVAEASPRGSGGVKIEAQFTVGEYDIVILSATDSAGLERWLKDNKYHIPDNAEPLLRPYVQEGSKFFVAKVDVTKVKIENGQAMLSPLRFHYDAETFKLPVRLGLVNSAGTQDLIVHILSKNNRFEVSNYKNVTIPTNIDVDEKAKDQFGAFYAALFDRTLEENPGAVVTEYSWDAASCDPCPGPALTGNDIATLGGDALPGGMQGSDDQGFGGQFVLTRLHARYKKETLGEDLVFRQAKPIVGGREFAGTDGKLEHGSREDSQNNFQGRYAVRHPWTGPIACANPRRGVWGGPPQGEQGSGPKAARDLAFAPRGGVTLPALVRQDIPEIKVKAAMQPVIPGQPAPSAAPSTPASATPSTTPAPMGTGAKSGDASGACGCSVPGAGDGPWAAVLAALGAALIAARRRASRRG